MVGKVLVVVGFERECHGRVGLGCLFGVREDKFSFFEEAWP